MNNSKIAYKLSRGVSKNTLVTEYLTRIFEKDPEAEVWYADANGVTTMTVREFISTYKEHEDDNLQHRIRLRNIQLSEF